MDEIESDCASHVRQLRWSLQALAAAGDEQQTLFPDRSLEPEALASDYDHWASVVRDQCDAILTPAQTAALSAIDRKLQTMSRDGADFDADLWTHSAMRASDHWIEVRRLANDALAALDSIILPGVHT
jgi:hypothetical protein